MTKRRKFSAEFKRGVVEQASQPGISCAQVARELGIRDSLLTRWRREAQSPGAIAFGGTGIPRDGGVGTPQARVGAGEEGTGFFARSRGVLCKGIILR